MDLAFQIIILIFSVVIHEVSHGYTADYLGDDTARRAGRLTLNPIKHLSMFGSIILPTLLYISSSGSFMFGWAKPVPYNPQNLKDPKKAAGLIGGAGPASNFIIAGVFALVYRLGVGVAAMETLLPLFSYIILINIVLGIFNLVPLPPLDGSKVLFSLLPPRFSGVERLLKQYGMFLLLFFIFFGFQLIVPLMFGMYEIMVGSPPVGF